MPKLLWHHLECMYPAYPEVAGLHLDEEDMEVTASLHSSDCTLRYLLATRLYSVAFVETVSPSVVVEVAEN